MSFYSLADHIYGCSWDDRIILLNSRSDSYSILDSDEKRSLELLLSQTDEIDTLNWDPTLFNKLRELLKKEGVQTRLPNAHYANLNIFDWTKKEGDYQHKKAFQLVLEALVLYTKIHFRLKSHSGLNSLLQQVKDRRKKLQKELPSEESILSVIFAVNRAQLIFPFSTRCLEWAFCYYFMGIRRGWPCSFLVGVTHLPFWSHAWVEINGVAISDEVHLPEDLKIILKEPFL